MDEIIIELGINLGKYGFKRELSQRSGLSKHIDGYAEGIFGKEILAIVKKHANVVSGAAVASAIPGGATAAIAAIVASTWKMYYDINEKIGISFSDNLLKSVASGVVSNLTSNGVAAVGNVGANLLSLIPGIGTLAAVGSSIAVNRISIHAAAVSYLKILNAIIDDGGDLSEKNISSRFGYANNNKLPNADNQHTYRKEIYDDGGYYEGYFSPNGLRDGYGTYVFANGDKYCGYFKDGAFNGRGKYTSNNGSIWDSEWVNGKVHGKGSYYDKSGVTITGSWRFGNPVGVMDISYSDGSSYKGTLDNDCKKSGYGTFRWKNGSKHIGNWKNDKRYGHGEYFSQNGALIQKGTWLNDEYINNPTSLDESNSCYGTNVTSRCDNEQWHDAYKNASNLLYDLEHCDQNARIRTLHIIEDNTSVS